MVKNSSFCGHLHFNEQSARHFRPQDRNVLNIHEDPRTKITTKSASKMQMSTETNLKEQTIPVNNSAQPQHNFIQTTALFSENAPLIEEIYQLYLQDPHLVDKSWQKLFANYPQSEDIQSTKAAAKSVDVQQSASTSNCGTFALIEAYRRRGHFLAKLDPLELEILPKRQDLQLNIEYFGFDYSDNEQIVILGSSNISNQTSLTELITSLETIYCNKIGVEFSHINNNLEREWLYQEFEAQSSQNSFTKTDKNWILEQLIKAEGFEQFIHTKFPGAKRFSVEGAESAIVCLNRIIDSSTKYHTTDIIIGMAHRGRVNALANVFSKPYKTILAEFLGTVPFLQELNSIGNIAGDVKYHLGYASTKQIDPNKNLNLTLAANPSHLESVNSVVAGVVRAKQDRLADREKPAILGVLLHGDAAFCGQGVVAENMAMSSLAPYNTCGIIHIIINNQLGFTANSTDTHVSRYSSEVAKIADAPILHVNGDEIEAVIKTIDFALNYRHKFGKDIVVEIICYRKYGHNEGDEPAYTQGVMYKIIHQKSSPAEIYTKKLLAEKLIDEAVVNSLKTKYKELLNQEYNNAKAYALPSLKDFKLNPPYSYDPITTGVAKKSLQDLTSKLYPLPQNFDLHPKLKTLLAQRLTAVIEDQPIDWAIAEALAFASLLNENISIRLVGQDSGRGTFSHRHSILYDQTNGNKYSPLNNLTQGQGNYFVADSNLSEYAALGFEYGYSLVANENLVIWEAQFGDFANGAQIIIDQYITSGETKWLQTSSLVMLLPHGYEGQGPEHSSARLERLLQLAAEDNIQIAYPTTPASIFHLLRRQVYNKVRKPLIIMSPKSLLRHKLAISNLTSLDLKTYFMPILDEQDQNIKPQAVEKLICCSGKLYYDLVEARNKAQITNTAITRFEQLYPLPQDAINKIMQKYSVAKEFIWAQEEPKNMGAWGFIRDFLNKSLAAYNTKTEFKYVGRKPSASPATGYLQIHNQEQHQLLEEALNLAG